MKCMKRQNRSEIRLIKLFCIRFLGKLNRSIILIIGFVWGSHILRAQSQATFLEIETGMHYAKINRISTNASGTLLLSCSDDKTARLWDVSNGTLLTTLRVPIGNNDDGKLYSCA